MYAISYEYNKIILMKFNQFDKSDKKQVLAKKIGYISIILSDIATIILLCYLIFFDQK